MIRLSSTSIPMWYATPLNLIIVLLKSFLHCRLFAMVSNRILSQLRNPIPILHNDPVLPWLIFPTLRTSNDVSPLSHVRFRLRH